MGGDGGAGAGPGRDHAGRGGDGDVAEPHPRGPAGDRIGGSGRPGGGSAAGTGRRPEEKDAALVEALRQLVDPATRGDPTRRCGGRR